MHRLIRRQEVVVGGVDSITDPVALAHHLVDLQGYTEEFVYTSHLRTSSLHSVCIRERILGLRSDALRTSRVGRDLAIIFEKGNFYHHLCQDTPLVFGDKRVGWWKCQACGGKYFGRPPRQHCKQCNAKPSVFRYSEHSMMLNDPVYITGHPDLFLEVEKADIRVAEIKSLDIDEFVGLRMPKADNAIQLLSYMEYLQHDRTLPIKPSPTKGLLVYFAKRGKKDIFPIKIFHVTKATHGHLLNPVVRDLTNFKRAVDDESYLPSVDRTCLQSGFNTYKARSCQVRDLCMQAVQQEALNGR